MRSEEILEFIKKKIEEYKKKKALQEAVAYIQTSRRLQRNGTKAREGES